MAKIFYTMFNITSASGGSVRALARGNLLYY